ncbi:hypothetical protein GGF37_001127 [Kickxella alabastrina]|nr:hypothetical protein GGF37_001127 [Kickxella alabastrina]
MGALGKLLAPRLRALDTHRAQIARLSTSCAWARWSAAEQKELIQMINNDFRGKIEGNWDLVAQHIRDVPINHWQTWSSAERKKLVDTVHQKYISKRRSINWERIGAEFNRTPDTCITVYYCKTVEIREARDAAERGANSGGEDLARLWLAVSTRTGATDADGVTSIDWAAVARDLGRPLLDVLALAYRHGISHSSESLLPRLAYPAKWPASRVQRLQAFVSENYLLSTPIPSFDPAPVDMNLASLFMGVHPADCAHAYESQIRVQSGIRAAHKAWQPEEIARLYEACTQRSKFRTWDDISAHVGTRSRSACYTCHMRQQDNSDQGFAEWTAENIALIEQHIQESPKQKHILPELCKMFPEKSKIQVRNQLHRCKLRLHMRRVQKNAVSQPSYLESCVKSAEAANGSVDWRAVSQALAVPPQNCKKAYEDMQRKQFAPLRWSREEVQRLMQTVEATKDKDDFCWNVVSRAVSTRTPQQCSSKYGYQLAKTAKQENNVMPLS